MLIFIFVFIYIPNPSQRLVLQGENINIAITDELVVCCTSINPQKLLLKLCAMYDTGHSMLGTEAVCNVDTSEKQYQEK